MDGAEQQMWSTAWRHAKAFLGRWNDVPTRNEREDLAQETAMLACGQLDRVRDLAAFPALVRTIARRTRAKSLMALARRGSGRRGVEPDSLPAHAIDEPMTVCGQIVDRRWLLAQLDQVLGRLQVLNRQLLLAFHEGFCCAELGARFRLAPQVVKVRLYRTRRKVQLQLEAKVRAAGCFELSVPQDDKEGRS